MVCQHPAKFGGYRHCCSGDIIILVCHVISQDHLIKGLCDFIGGRFFYWGLRKFYSIANFKNF